MSHLRPTAATLCVSLALAAVGYATSQSTESASRFDRVTAVLDRYITAGELAGAVSLIYHRGEVVHVAARGVQDTALATPMGRDTIFGLASMTKPITATAAMMLVERGKIGLDDPVDDWLPELADRTVLDDPNGPLDNVHTAPRAITLRDLLRYTMGLGIPGWAGIDDDAPFVEAFTAARRGAATGDEYLQRLGALPLLFAPGERFVYHTPSMVTGVLISRVSGMPLDQFFETEIFRPLGMHDTGFWVPTDKRPRLASYYRAGTEPGTLVPTADNDTRYLSPPSFPSAGGGLVSTVDDYLQFARMLLGRGEVDGVRILSPASVDLMTDDQMPKEPHRRFFINESFWDGSGFGLGLQVVTEPRPGGPAVGSFWWQGATGVAWTADPAEEMIFLRFIQRSGAPRAFSADYRQAVYEAIAH